MDKNNKRDIKLIFIFLSILSLSIGIWENYKSIWLEINNINISNISLIISASLIATSFISIALIIIFKKFNMLILIRISLIIRCLSFLAMILSFNKTIQWLKIFSFFIETISINLIIISIYPLITQKLKSYKIYSHRKLIEYLFTDIGILIAGGIIAFKLAGFFEYNILAIASLILTIACIPITFLLKSDNSEKKIKIKAIFKDKIINIYLIYWLIQSIAYNVALGLMSLLLKNLLGIPINYISIFLLASYILGDAFGYLALYKLNFKNDYLTYSCKFVLRLICYILIAITGNFYVAIIGIFLSLFVSRAWENVADGVYINRASKENQLAFANIRYAIGKIGMAIGVLISGQLFKYGIKAIFACASGIMLISISLAFYLIHLRHKEEKSKEDKSSNSMTETLENKSISTEITTEEISLKPENKIENNEIENVETKNIEKES